MCRAQTYGKLVFSEFLNFLVFVSLEFFLFCSCILQQNITILEDIVVFYYLILSFSYFCSLDEAKSVGKKQKSRLKKVPWSKEESLAVLEFFSVAIKNKKVPGKREAEACIQANPCLKSRSWKVVKDFIRNYIVKLQKIKKHFLWQLQWDQ